jgi:hypothetical protein
VHASWPQFSAPFAFVAIVEAFVTIVEAVVVVVAVPYPDASVVNAFRKRCGRNGKECRDSYRKDDRKDVSAHKHLHHIIALKLPADCICSSVVAPE